MSMNLTDIKALKKAIFRLIEKDEEFRLALAGKLGLAEILRKLREHDEKFNKLLEENHKIWMEIEEIKKEIKKIWEEIVTIKKENMKIWNEIYEIKKEIREIKEEDRRIWKEIRGIKRYMEEMSISLEEEAREQVHWFLRRKYGIEVELDELMLPDLEFDIYGVSGDYCILGEATVRLGIGTIRDFIRKIDEVKRKYPGILRKNNIYVIYCMWTTKDAIDEAKRNGIWLIKIDKELTSPSIP